MSYFDQVYSGLFGKTASPGILVDAVIRRSKTFLKRFNAWKSSERCEELLNELWQSYFWSRSGIDKDPQILLLETPHSNGLAISYQSECNKYHFHYLFDYIADQVKKLDYRLVTSKLTMRERGKNVETREMHHLKPKADQEDTTDQKYSNVQVEYIRVNNQPSRIKLIASIYPNRKAGIPRNFESLAQHIFSIEP